MKAAPTCASCAHFYSNWMFTAFGLQSCHRPGKPRHPVTGHQQVVFCDTERTKGECGPRGRFHTDVTPTGPILELVEVAS